jgi:hypothetical protein
MSIYAIGTAITLKGTFKDVNGVLTDPTTVECDVIQPNRQVSTITASKVSTGVYTATFTPMQPGGHSYKFSGTGNCQVAGYNDFQVIGSF